MWRAYVCVSVHAHAYGGQMLMMRIISRLLFYHINWCRVPQLNPELINTASLTRLFQGFSVTTFWDLNDKWATTPSWQWLGFWGHELWSSHLHSKHFNCWTISPAPEAWAMHNSTSITQDLALMISGYLGELLIPFKGIEALRMCGIFHGGEAFLWKRNQFLLKTYYWVKMEIATGSERGKDFYLTLGRLSGDWANPKQNQKAY